MSPAAGAVAGHPPVLPSPRGSGAGGLARHRRPVPALAAPVPGTGSLAPVPGSGPLQVLVLNHEGRSFGLVVERILDIVEDPAEVRMDATRANILYSVVIGERVTELLDVPAVLRVGDVPPSRRKATARTAEAIH